MNVTLTKINQNEALRYLGYRKGMDITDIRPSLDICEKRLIERASARYIYKIFPIEFTTGVAISGSNIVFSGEDIKNHLKNCTHIIILTATLGASVDMLINSLQKTNMSEALITDSLANAAIEQVCNKAEEDISKALNGKHFTWRFSPGYGDFPLDYQSKIIEITQSSKKIGLCVNPSGMLIPVKSVTAIIGISDSPIEKGRRGCVVCNLKDTCQYRKNGLPCTE